jgi:LysM repeat protein
MNPTYPRLQTTLLTLLVALMVEPLFAQNNADARDYILKHRELALKNEQCCSIPASITLAQALIESGNGSSQLALQANNHFGIKCHTKDWTGPGYYKDDDAPNECFRKYESVQESYSDHAQFLRSRPRYSSLFALDPTNYTGWAQGLKDAGYATNPEYANMLIRCIEEHQLHQISWANHPYLQAARSEQAPNTPGATPLRMPWDFPASPCQDGVFRYNYIRTVCSQSGDDLLAVATRHQFSLWKLLALNGYSENVQLPAGQKVFLEKRRKKGVMDRHQMAAGQRVMDVARYYGIREASLRLKNNLQMGDEVVAGQTLSLRRNVRTRLETTTLEEIERLRRQLAGETNAGTAPRRDPGSTPADRMRQEAPVEEGYHRVLTQETLYSLARRYKVKVEELRLWNNLPNDQIKIGQILRIKAPK